MKRLFIAIDLPFEIKEILNKYKEELAKYITYGVKWVELENLHFTIRFLGETEENKIPDIQRIMDEVSCEFFPFSISFNELGAFPSFKNPRVIWIGIENGKREMKTLFQRLEDKIVKLGFQREEKEFSPHLTLGRVKDKFRWEKEWKIDIPYLEFLAEEITLFESKLTSKGPIYNSLYKSKFSKNI
ncbi:MAG: RNA 2',3'-cyclic phosphodiesterase [Dictyoglomaceae bacterium]